MAHVCSKHTFADSGPGKPPQFNPYDSYINFKKYAVFIAGTAIYNVTFHPLATFPDPKFRVALEIPSFWELCSGDSPANIEALHDEFGHIVRISPNVLSFGSSEAWRGMLLSIILLPTDDQ
jgi:hypothetical protein